MLNKNPWKHLVLNTGDTVSNILSSIGYRRSDHGGLKYIPSGQPENLIVAISKRLMMATIREEINDLVNHYKYDAQRKAVEKRRKQIKTSQENNIKLIENYEKSKNWGHIVLKCPSGTANVVVTDKYGHEVKEALVLSYDSQKEHNVTFSSINKTYTTSTIFHVDLAPRVSMSSGKNIVMTQVQGRDYTRKELVSGGDLKFTVRGIICSDTPGMYPSAEVSKFVKIMQHNGILDVNFMVFDRLGIEKVIITDFTLDSSDYINEQPYTFSCVAVEPDEEIMVNDEELNRQFNRNVPKEEDKIIENSLNKKLADAADDMTVNAIVSSLNNVADMTNSGLDSILKNI